MFFFLGGIDKWIPIKIHTYRDDIILLAQEQNSASVDLFTWSGTDGGFIKLSDYSCNFSDDDIENNSDGKITYSKYI